MALRLHYYDYINLSEIIITYKIIAIKYEYY